MLYQATLSIECMDPRVDLSEYMSSCKPASPQCIRVKSVLHSNLASTPLESSGRIGSGAEVGLSTLMEAGRGQLWVARLLHNNVKTICSRQLDPFFVRLLKA
jgi:hypothetical protein